jgi:hypothetical protein
MARRVQAKHKINGSRSPGGGPSATVATARDPFDAEAFEDVVMRI